MQPSPLKTFRAGAKDSTSEPMFCGNSVAIARLDVYKYHFFVRLVERQQSYFWRPNEVNLTLDRNEFRNRMLPHEREIFMKNLSYQVVMDSEQGRAPALIFLALCSLPELESWLTIWTAFEGIHNQAYAHMMRSVLDDASVIFDKITTDNEIVKRTVAVSEEYDKLYDLICRKHVIGVDPHELKVQLYRTLACVNALESIRFFVSFACTFIFGERNIIEGCAKIMKFIARDEDLHCQGTEHMLKLMANGLEGEEWAAIAAEQRPFLIEIMKTVSLQEMEWADYLFVDGAILGLNASILKQYIKYRTNLALERLDIEHAYPDVTTDPLPWMDKWTKSDPVQVAPQEAEISSYQIGQIDPHVEEETLLKYKFE